jgi:hypothetical protein
VWKEVVAETAGGVRDHGVAEIGYRRRVNEHARLLSLMNLHSPALQHGRSGKQFAGNAETCRSTAGQRRPDGGFARLIYRAKPVAAMLSFACPLPGTTGALPSGIDSDPRLDAKPSWNSHIVGA